MSSHHSLPPRVLEPECARFAGLLPVLGDGGADAFETASAGAHAAGCAHCQAELAAYERLAGALRHHFGPEAAPRLNTADLLWSSTGLPLENILEEMMRDAPEPTGETAAAPAHDEADTVDHPAFRPLPEIRAGKTARGPWRALSAFAAVAAVLSVAVTAQMLFVGGRGHSTGAGHAKPTATATAPGANVPSITLDAVSMVSADDGWAVGESYSGTNSGPSNDGYLMRYANGHWTAITIPCRCAKAIRAIAMVSATDGWAAGDQGTMLHYDGQAWKPVAIPQTTVAFTAISMASSTQGWAIVEGGDPNAGPWEYHNGVWKPETLPTVSGFQQQYGLTLWGITGHADGEAWAVGEVDGQGAQASDGKTGTLIASAGVIFHEVNGHWSLQRLLPNASLHGVAMVSATEGWAVGSADQVVTYPGLPNAIPPIPPSTATTQTPLLLHYHNGQWQAAPSPQMSADFTQGTLTQVAMSSPSEGWALEKTNSSFVYDAGSASVSDTLLHYVNGQWTQVDFPRVSGRDAAYLQALTVTQSGEAWAVGWTWMPVQFNTRGPSNEFILHYQGGKWSVVAS